MAGKRGKMLVGLKEKGQESKIMDVDMTSKLPDDVIYHVLSLLSTIDAVRTSFISRRWIRIYWNSTRNLEFSDRGYKTKSLCKFLEQSLSHLNVIYYDTKPAITKFKLEMYYHGHNSQELDGWLRLITQSQLEELEFKLKEDYFRRVDGQSREKWYCLPEVALNLTSLTFLKLEYVKLETRNPISFPSLKSLFLENLHVEDELLYSLVLGSPSLEKLIIVYCATLFNIRISSLSLRFFEMIGHEKDRSILQVEAKNLESFLFWGHWYCNFDLTSCKKLTSLLLSGAFFYGHDDLSNLISTLPALESLTITECHLYDIRHPNLKVLVFEKYEDHPDQKHEISIEAPNLVSFSYRGEDTLIRFSFNSQNLLDAKIDLESYSSDAISMDWWYTNIANFLSYLDCFKSMSLFLRSEEALIFPENLKNIRPSPLPNLKHLKVVTARELLRKSDLRDALLWVSPSLETLSIEQKEVHISLLQVVRDNNKAGQGWDYFSSPCRLLKLYLSLPKKRRNKN